MLKRRHGERGNPGWIVTGRKRFGRVATGVLVGTGLALSLAVAQPGLAMAHTDDDAEFKHVVIEFGLWGIGLVAVIALLVGVFWVRARLLRRGE